MRARHPVLVSLCVSILAASVACTDAVGPTPDSVQPGMPSIVQNVVVVPAKATLPTGQHVAMKVASADTSSPPMTIPVGWSSSDTTVASVSSSGDVVAVRPGNAVITASVGGSYATAALTVVPQAPVESVTVVPKKADVVAGQSVQLAVTMGGQDKADGVTWESSNPQVASVSSSGLVTGVAAGIASIRATYGGQTSTAAVTVLVPSPIVPPPTTEPPTSQSGGSDTPTGGILWSHQPTGMSVLTNQSWNSIPSLGWLIYDDYHKLELVADPTVPTGDPKVLQFDFPEGFTGGNGPALAEYHFKASEVYIGFYWKLSPNWQQHPSNLSKLFYVFQRLTSDDRQAIFMVIAGSDGGPYHLQISNEPDGGKWWYQNVNNATIVPDRWYKIELHLKRSSADGAPDGLVEWWVDGQLAARYTDAKLRDEPFSEVHVAPVWGGFDPVHKLHDDYQRFGHFYVSGR